MKNAEVNASNSFESTTTERPPNVDFNREFTTNEKSQAMGVVAVGALIANIPIITLINWYGPRYIFTFVGFFGAIATALIPHALNTSFNWYPFFDCFPLLNPIFCVGFWPLEYFKESPSPATWPPLVILSPIGRIINSMPSSRPLCASTSNWRPYSRILYPVKFL